MIFNITAYNVIYIIIILLKKYTFSIFCAVSKFEHNRITNILT